MPEPREDFGYIDCELTSAYYSSVPIRIWSVAVVAGREDIHQVAQVPMVVLMAQGFGDTVKLKVAGSSLDVASCRWNFGAGWGCVPDPANL